jgi:hypothetical protein
VTHSYWSGPSGVTTLALALGPGIYSVRLNPETLNVGVVRLLLAMGGGCLDGLSSDVCAVFAQISA